MTIPIPKEEIEDTAKLLLEDNPRLSIDEAVDYSKRILEASVGERYDDMRTLLHQARHWPFLSAQYMAIIDEAERCAEKLIGDESIIADYVRAKGR